MKKYFKRNFDSLEKIVDFIQEFVAQYQLDMSISFAINLAIEELFTNMVKYKAQATSDVLIDLSKDAKKVIVLLIENDVEPYDITEAKAYDPTRPLEERKPGGVGIHLVNKFFDEINYEYQDRTSKITLIKYLEKNYARD